MKSISNVTVEQIEAWPLNEDGYHVSPDGLQIKLGRRVTIGKECLLFDRSQMGDDSRMGDRSQMGDDSRMGDKILISKSITSIRGSKYTINWYSPTQIAIGCNVRTPEEWERVYKKVAKEEDFEDDQVTEYRAYFDLLVKMGPVGFSVRTDEDLKKDREEFEASQKAWQEELARLLAIKAPQEVPA